MHVIAAVGADGSQLAVRGGELWERASRKAGFDYAVFQIDDIKALRREWLQVIQRAATAEAHNNAIHDD